MNEKRSGMKNPINKARGLQRIMLALVVLLLASVLMVGAVSADEPTVITQQNFNGITSDGKPQYDIGTPGDYVIKSKVEGIINIILTQENGVVNITAEENGQLYGRIAIGQPSNKLVKLNVTGLTIHINKTWVADGYIRAISDINYIGPTIVLKNNKLFVDDDVKGTDYKAQFFASSTSLRGDSVISGNEINGVTSHAIEFNGVGTDSTMTIIGNTASIYPCKEERGFVKIWGSDSANQNMNLIIQNNVITNTNSAQTIAVLRIDENMNNYANNLVIELKNNSLDGDTYSDYMYEGDIAYDKFKQINTFTVKDTNDNIVLIKGLNQTKNGQTFVEWYDNTFKITRTDVTTNYVVKKDVGIILTEDSVPAGTDITINGVTPASIIEIDGETSIVNQTSKVLTAKLSTTDGLGRTFGVDSVTWKILEGADIISLSAETGETNTITAKKVSTAKIYLKVLDGSSEVTITVTEAQTEPTPGEGDAGEGDNSGEGDAGEGDNSGEGDAGEGDNSGEGDAGEGDNSGEGDAGEGDNSGDSDAGEGDNSGEGDAGEGEAETPGTTEPEVPAGTLEGATDNTAIINPPTSGEVDVETSADGNSKTVTIEAGSGVTIKLTGASSDVNKDSSTGVVTGTFNAVEAVYDNIPADLKDSQTPVSYGLIIPMNPNTALEAGIPLPTIDATFKTNVASKVAGHNGNSYNSLAMIQATYSAGGIDIINNNLSGEVTVTFTLPASVGQKLVVFHVPDNNGVPVLLAKGKVTITTNAAGNIVVTAKGTGFSSYVVAQDTTPAPQSSSTPQGSSVWLTEPQTPTQTPSEQPTEKPTDVAPTDVPTTQPTPTQTESPGFGILAVLAGLGAVAVLRRK